MHRLRLLPAAALVLAVLIAPASAVADDVRTHLQRLVDIGTANGGNRAAGQPGGAATVEYLAERLAAFGWQVRRTPVTFPGSTERSPAVLGTAQPGRDFNAMRGSGSGSGTGRVRVITAERCTKSAVRSLRRGEIAIADGLYCSPRRAANLVKARGGIALLYNMGPDTYPLRASLEEVTPIPTLGVRLSVLRRMARSTKPIQVKVDMAIAPVTVENVVAELPGDDRIVMAGAHLDSVEEGVGANDNASGVAALLDVAEKLPAQKPAATVRLGFWNAEELGLFGSRAYVKGLSSAERKRFRAYLNFDMVGSPNGRTEVYASSKAIEKVLRDALPGREGKESLDAASDHQPFDAAGIPVGGVYTGSTEETGGKPRDPCYHRSCDGLSNVDVPDVERAAGAALSALRSLGR